MHPYLRSKKGFQLYYIILSRAITGRFLTFCIRQMGFV